MGHLLAHYARPHTDILRVPRLIMERYEIIGLMAELVLNSMRYAYDKVIADALKRQHLVQQVVGDLSKAEVAEKHDRSIKCQMTTFRLPLARKLEGFEFTGTPVNVGLVRDLATGSFL